MKTYLFCVSFDYGSENYINIALLPSSNTQNICSKYFWWATMSESPGTVCTNCSPFLVLRLLQLHFVVTVQVWYFNYTVVCRGNIPTTCVWKFYFTYISMDVFKRNQTKSQRTTLANYSISTTGYSKTKYFHCYLIT